MEPALETVADGQKPERDRKRDHDDAPLPDPAGDTDTGREPGTGGAGQPANPKMMFGADDDSRAEKADAGDDSLNGPAGGIGKSCRLPGWIGRHTTMAVARPTRPSVFKPMGLP